ncbi:MAG: hypothetical protein KDI63_11690 [Gammaproteobacteria bacterium]|nr:hypothetical protein [Gammaproteobacteria bacterium]
MKQEQIQEALVVSELKRILADTLRIDEATIEADSSLINDLGAESLDFLDVVYQLEQTFGIKMARHQVLEHVEELFGEDKAIDEESGELTAGAIAMLRLRFGEDSPDIDEGMDMDDVPKLVTVSSMARAVMDILNTLPETCGECGAAAWKLEGTKILCGNCQAAGTFENGDDLTQAWLKRAQEEHHLF